MQQDQGGEDDHIEEDVEEKGAIMGHAFDKNHLSGVQLMRELLQKQVVKTKIQQFFSKTVAHGEDEVADESATVDYNVGNESDRDMSKAFDPRTLLGQLEGDKAKMLEKIKKVKEGKALVHDDEKQQKVMGPKPTKKLNKSNMSDKNDTSMVKKGGFPVIRYNPKAPESGIKGADLTKAVPIKLKRGLSQKRKRSEKDEDSNDDNASAKGGTAFSMLSKKFGGMMGGGGPKSSANYGKAKDDRIGDDELSALSKKFRGFLPKALGAKKEEAPSAMQDDELSALSKQFRAFLPKVAAAPNAAPP